MVGGGSSSEQFGTGFQSWLPDVSSGEDRRGRSLAVRPHVWGMWDKEGLCIAYGMGNGRIV